jgi:Aminoglycoside-2''-adenylyltransferase
VTPESLDVDLGAWDAWSPREAARRLERVAAPWYVIAGWALDLYLGRQTREHDDLEIGIPADCFPEIRSRPALQGEVGSPQG